MQKKYAAWAVMSLILMNPLTASAEGKNGVAATINGEDVTVSEIREAYEMNPMVKGKISFDDFYGKALDFYVNGKILYQAAVADNITSSPEYKNQLEMAKEELARKMYLEQQVDKQISKSDIEKVYNQYKSTFKPEKEVKAKHILVADEKTANEVIAKLKKGGKFDTLAKEYSKEPAELGYFTKETMVPEFANAAFAMKKGQYSQKPVKTQFGYHVIMVEDVRNTKPLPLSDVEQQIKAQLSQKAVGDVFNKVNKGAKVVKYNLDGSVMK